MRDPYYNPLIVTQHPPADWAMDLICGDQEEEHWSRCEQADQWQRDQDDDDDDDDLNRWGEP